MTIGIVFSWTLGILHTALLLAALVSTTFAALDWERDGTPPLGKLGVALTLWSGFLAWLLTLLIGAWLFPSPPLGNQDIFIKLASMFFGLLVALASVGILEELWPEAETVPALPVKKPEAVKQTAPPSTTIATFFGLGDRPAQVPVVKTAIDRAHAVRDPVSAWANDVATNARIRALENAGRLAAATAVAAEAEIKGLDLMLQREERLTEMRSRQQIAHEIHSNQIEEQRIRLKESENQRKLALERHTKEHLEGKRATANARNGLEAVKHFKKFSYELGEKRVRARMADAEADTATARAASRKLGEDPDGLQELADAVRQRILTAEAEGQDTEWLRDHLAKVEGMLDK